MLEWIETKHLSLIYGHMVSTLVMTNKYPLKAVKMKSSLLYWQMRGMPQYVTQNMHDKQKTSYAYTKWKTGQWGRAE